MCRFSALNLVLCLPSTSLRVRAAAFPSIHAFLSGCPRNKTAPRGAVGELVTYAMTPHTQNGIFSWRYVGVDPTGRVATAVCFSRRGQHSSPFLPKQPVLWRTCGVCSCFFCDLTVRSVRNLPFSSFCPDASSSCCCGSPVASRNPPLGALYRSPATPTTPPAMGVRLRATSAISRPRPRRLFAWR